MRGICEDAGVILLSVVLVPAQIFIMTMGISFFLDGGDLFQLKGLLRPLYLCGDGWYGNKSPRTKNLETTGKCNLRPRTLHHALGHGAHRHGGCLYEQ